MIIALLFICLVQITVILWNVTINTYKLKVYNGPNYIQLGVRLNNVFPAKLKLIQL